ncbi:MAG: NAD-dependent epimerase/dehydratase family protein [Phycisphaerae bacterium]
MAGTVLITGGAGFIGSHVADELLAAGHRVRVLDSLWSQVHGENPKRPEYLNDEVQFIRGDVCDPAAVGKALDGVDVVYHFAAAVGVGQSMYKIADYTRTNDLGTAVLCEAMIDRKIKRLIVASSMSIYGEGLYRDSRGRMIHNASRTIDQLQRSQWDILDEDGRPLEPLATPETKRISLSSVYAANKFNQETLCMVLGRFYGLETVALRFWNVYGPRQALSNPYTGVLAIFASRLMNNKPPLINEDGCQQRDLVSVHDVAAACRLAMEVPQAAGQVLNIASGRRITIRQLADRLAQAMGKEHIQPKVTGEYRAGDIRHCVPDISLAREVLGYEPGHTLESSLDELTGWLDTQVAHDRVEESRRELAQRGLSV